MIYLFQSGAPSQIDLFDYKPRLADRFDEDLQESIRQGQRLTGMTSGQKRFPVAPSIFKFAQHGASRAWVSELMPHVAEVADELCFIKSMHTEAINHDPGDNVFPDRATSIARPPEHGVVDELRARHRATDNLPAFVAMLISNGQLADQEASRCMTKLWSSGFLPSDTPGRAIPRRQVTPVSVSERASPGSIGR